MELIRPLCAGQLLCFSPIPSLSLLSSLAACYSHSLATLSNRERINATGCCYHRLVYRYLLNLGILEIYAGGPCISTRYFRPDGILAQRSKSHRDRHCMENPGVRVLHSGTTGTGLWNLGTTSHTLADNWVTLIVHYGYLRVRVYPTKHILDNVPQDMT